METYPVIKVPERFSVLEQPAVLPQLRPSPWCWLALILTGVFLILAWWALWLLGVAAVCLGVAIWDYGRSLRRYQQILSRDRLEQQQERVRGLTIVAYTQPTDIQHEGVSIPLAEALRQIPEVEVMQQQRLGIHIPDVILQDRSLGLWCCIEVDEPWYFREGDGRKCPNHWIGKDDRRDEEFLDCGWIVIRFAESQVALDLEGCVQEVASVLARYNPGRERVQTQLRRVARWTGSGALRISRVYTEADRR